MDEQLRNLLNGTNYYKGNRGGESRWVILIEREKRKEK